MSQEMIFIVLYHPFILLEIMIRALAGSSLAAGLLLLIRPKDPRIRHVGWIGVLLITPAVMPLWFLVPEVEVPPIPGLSLLVVDAAPTIQDSSESISVPPYSPPRRRGLPVVVTIWLVVAAVRLGWVANGVVGVHRLHRAVRRFGDASFPGVHVAFSERVVVPVTTGILRPIVLLPPIAKSWSESRKRAVLLHEIAHLKRRDLWTTWLAELIVAFFWFNPIVWLARREQMRAAEQASDAMAASLMPDRSTYAEELVSLASAVAGRSRRVLGHVAFTKGALETRIDAILRGRPATSTRVFVIGVMGCFLFSAVLAFLSASITPGRLYP